MAMESRSAVGDRVHPVHWFAGRVHEVLDGLTAGGVRVATMSGAEVAEAITELSTAVSRLEGLRLALLAHADRVDVGAESGATSTGAWLAQTIRTPAPAAHRMVRLSRRLELDHGQTAVELQAGGLDPVQAAVIVEAVDALPSWVGGEERARAEKHLLSEASRHDARALKLLARHVLEVIDPEAADTELAARLEAEETAAARRTMLTMFDDGKGSCHGTFRIPTLHGAMLSKALHALASPTRSDPIPRQDNGPDGIRPRLLPEVLGQAFCELLERFPTRKLPTSGGINATVVVTIALPTLLGGLGIATLDTRAGLTAGQARRLACQAGVIPAVLGGESEILDWGRRRRLHTPSQRLALGLRDKGCTVEGCDRPAAWCHTHHDLPWAAGGGTSTQNGRLLCPRHHTLVHHPAYTVAATTNGRIRLSRTTRRRQ